MFIKRFITIKLKDWKNRKSRKPLILRGARQIGKTWSILNFGKNHFNGNVHVIDLEKHPDWHRVFKPNLDVKRILSEIIHNMLLEELRKYFFIGGMPECVRYFAEINSIRSVMELQLDLIKTFRQDFSKYTPYSNKHCLNQVLSLKFHFPNDSD
ncbi:MAG: AAA family ATPase [Candidatus Marinimicrobia bacterium]|nr:AAA family ATPase [Candidatus Neomarinimicrobiota bacterium]